SVSSIIFLCFFFHAEDGIRDRNVTGVQTCALLILFLALFQFLPLQRLLCYKKYQTCTTDMEFLSNFLLPLSKHLQLLCETLIHRSEERRVGRECRSWWS